MGHRMEIVENCSIVAGREIRQCLFKILTERFLSSVDSKRNRVPIMNRDNIVRLALEMQDWKMVQ